MSTDLHVLRALLRLSRRARPATLEDVVASVREDAAAVQQALAALARAGLVQRTGESPRLSLAGLAVAVAAAAKAKAEARRAKTLTSSARASRSTHARVIPMVRRRRAAA